MNASVRGVSKIVEAGASLATIRQNGQSAARGFARDPRIVMVGAIRRVIVER
jgi:hypothetical protein